MTPLDLEDDPLDRGRFPIEPWRFVEVEHDHTDLGRTETLFAVGNGYLGMRGNPEEGRDAYAHGTFVNGFHETWNIHHAEKAFGFATTGQTIVNVPDSKTIKIYVDDEPLLLSTADLEDYERALDFRNGTLDRALVWRTPAGKRVRIRSRRLVSFTQRHLAVYTLELTMLTGDAPVVISSQILNRQDGQDEYLVSEDSLGQGRDPRKAAKLGHRVLLPRHDWHSDKRMLLGWRAANSGMTIAVGADHTITTDNAYDELIDTTPDLGRRVYRVDAREGRPIVVTKAVAYHTSRGVPTRELFDRCRRTLDRVRESGLEPIFTGQRDWLDRFWEDSDVEIEGRPAVQQAVRWNLYQLAQASARADQLGVAAKGVTGSGYEGHYFWDTEIYVMPFLTYTSPDIARSALRFRVNLLPAARERARELSQKGALYPWRTINGLEASAYYAAGTAQYHIDADIAYSLVKYVDVTGDQSFLERDGVDVLVETARLWADLGFWRQNDGHSFNIHGVTGPDEYTTVVNNNLFTNVMARFNLERAAEAVRTVERNNAAAYARLVSRLQLEPGEIEEWERCARHMTIPFDETLGIHPQDDDFLQRELWDLASTPDDKRPLLLHFHPLVIYRFQVLKQADVVLALFLMGHRFTAAEKRADFEYYDPITTGDSTLSAVVQSIIAAEVGYAEMALRYFHTGLYVDLLDLHRNTSDGVHIASAGGVWSALVNGFAGMRDYHGALSFDPRLPREWPSLAINLTYRGTRLRVEIRQDELVAVVKDGDPVHFSVRGSQHTASAGAPCRVPLNDQGRRLPSLEGSSPFIGGIRDDGTVITAGLPTIEPDDGDEDTRL